MLPRRYEAGVYLDRGRWLKAGGIFVISLGMATAVGLAFSALSPSPECGFSVLMNRERVEGGLKATLTYVDGTYNITDVEYRIVLLRGDVSSVIMEGNLTSALKGMDGVTYHPNDPSRSVLEEGDYLTVDVDDEAAHVLLLTRSGTPLGWTVGCEG
ncbi:MAG: hypothetical protein ACE5HJ_07110 [Thermoplasmata archaeon]